MNIRDLRTFLSVAELGSVTLAAEALGRSQPAVSRCVQDLEEMLGFALLERVGRRIQLSPEGAAFEEEARRLVASVEDLPARTLARAGQGRAPLSIAATPALASGLVPKALALWPARERPAEIRITQGVPNAVAQDLLSGRARIGLASLPLDVHGVSCLKAFNAPLVAALPRALAGDLAPGPIGLRALAQMAPLVSMLDQTRLQGRIAHQLSLSGATPCQDIHVNSSLTALALVRTGTAVAVIEPITAYGLPVDDVVLRPLAEPIAFSLGFFAAGGPHLSRPVTRFFELCEAALLSMIPGIEPIALGPEAKTGADE